MSNIITLDGKSFDYRNINKNDIDIETIAKVLSRIPRWLGHTTEFYSVAQHCCWCYDNTKGNKLQALMHDASEAYIGDCPSPLKELLPNLILIENQIQKEIAKKYHYDYPFSKETHNVDKEALQFEWDNVKCSYNTQFWCFSKAEQEFLDRFNKIKSYGTVS